MSRSIILDNWTCENWEKLYPDKPKPARCNSVSDPTRDYMFSEGVVVSGGGVSEEALWQQLGELLLPLIEELENLDPNPAVVVNVSRALQTAGFNAVAIGLCGILPEMMPAVPTVASTTLLAETAEIRARAYLTTKRFQEADEQFALVRLYSGMGGQLSVFDRGIPSGPLNR